jgi:DNA repair exonuclease SbcCD ATPase subunit
MQALPEILEQLVAAGELDRILIVSHQDELATAFEQTLTISCENSRSRIEDGVRLEAVSA